MQLVKKFPAIYRTWRSIAVFIIACHKTISWEKWIQCTPTYPAYLGFTLILLCHLCVGLWSGLLRSGFLIKICMHILPLPYVLHPTHLILHWISIKAFEKFSFSKKNLITYGLTFFKLNIKVEDMVIGQYFVCRSNLDLILLSGVSVCVLSNFRFRGTNLLFCINTPKSFTGNKETI